MGVAAPLDRPAQSSGSSAEGEVSDTFVSVFLVGLVLVPLLLWSVRSLLLRRIRQQMMVTSSEQSALSAADVPAEPEQASLPPAFETYEARSQSSRW